MAASMELDGGRRAAARSRPGASIVGPGAGPALSGWASGPSRFPPIAILPSSPDRTRENSKPSYTLLMASANRVVFAPRSADRRSAGDGENAVRDDRDRGPYLHDNACVSWRPAASRSRKTVAPRARIQFRPLLAERGIGDPAQPRSAQRY